MTILAQGNLAWIVSRTSHIHVLAIKFYFFILEEIKSFTRTLAVPVHPAPTALVHPCTSRKETFFGKTVADENPC